MLTLKEQDDLTNLRQDVESAVSEGALGAVDDAVEPVPTPGDHDNWKVKGAISLDDAERVQVKRRLYDLQGSCRAKKQKVLETVVERFGLAEELFLGGGSAHNPNQKDAQAGRYCELEQQLREVRKGAIESSTKVIELEMMQQKAERTRDDAMTTL